MRWEALFADLEAQLSAADAADRAADVAELTRAERATVGIGDRLRASRGTRLDLHLAGAERVTGELLEVAAHWVLLGEGPRRSLVPTAAVGAVTGLGAYAEPTTSTVLRRVGLGQALRALARDRVRLRVSTVAGTWSGRIDRVGADHLDLVTGGPADGPAAVLTLPFAALTVLRDG